MVGLILTLPLSNNSFGHTVSKLTIAVSFTIHNVSCHFFAPFYVSIAFHLGLVLITIGTYGVRAAYFH